MSFATTQFIYVLALYGLVVLIPFLFLCYAPLKSMANWKMNLGVRNKGHSKEIIPTLLSFTVLYGCLVLMSEVSFTKLSTLKYVLSFPLIVLVHDAYFYWTHWLMHKSKFLYRFHKQHHTSSDATPLDVLAFHPVEAFVHFIFFVIYPMIIPTELSVMQFMFVWMLVCNSAGHLPYEFYPKFLYDFPVIREFNAATHHQMHHKYYTTNFSIYYNWWDRWMNTNHKEYFVIFKKVKASQIISEKPSTFTLPSISEVVSPVVQVPFSRGAHETTNSQSL
jgi:sterol desaturase/sphingolipid hydroxylase (fatty acid hydroxylase superfamily)